MKIEIQISDFYLDEQQDLEPALKHHVVSTVTQSIWKSIEKKVEDHLTIAIKDQVEKIMYQKMAAVIDDVIKTGTVKSSRNSNMITIEEYIKEKFAHDSGWSSPNDKIGILAKQFGDELKKRYDLMFASHVVSQMNKNGFLKEDVAKMLLSDN